VTGEILETIWMPGKGPGDGPELGDWIGECEFIWDVTIGPTGGYGYGPRGTWYLPFES